MILSLFFHKNNRKEFTEFKKLFIQSFDLKDLGELKCFLGVRILRDRPNGQLWLCQDSYIDKIANKFNLQTSKPPKTH